MNVSFRPWRESGSSAGSAITFNVDHLIETSGQLSTVGIPYKVNSFVVTVSETSPMPPNKIFVLSLPSGSPVLTLTSQEVNSLPYGDSYKSITSYKVTQSTNWSMSYEDACDCEDDSECPEGQKCVDCECVDCDQQQATHFQIRFEYDELVTTSDAKQVMFTLSSIYPISGSEGQIIQGQETSGVWYYPRIRFCDSDGEARPYTGALAFYGYCNPDRSTALYSNNRGDLQEISWVIGQKATTDSVSNNPWSVPRILIEFIEPSAVIYEPDCSGVAGSGFPPIDPVQPTEPEEPLPPDPGDPPDEIDEPLPPDPIDGTGGGEPPPEPQQGLCDCEKYLAKMILAGTQQIRNAIVDHGNQLDARLADGYAVLYERITSLERVLYQQNSETNRLLYELSMYLFQPFHAEIVTIRKTLQKSLESGDDGLIDIVKTGLVEGDKGLVDYVEDFVEQYEPVTIENEYRTQSHRVIDNLDQVVNKL